MRQRNTLICRTTFFSDNVSHVDVGSRILFDFKGYGSCIAKVVEVVGDYATYLFPEDFDLKPIKEKIYEQNKKSVSVQSH